VRVGDLANPSSLAEAVRHNVAARNRIIGDSTMDARQVLDDLARAWERMRPWVTDVSLFLDRARKEGRAIMFEGAQGTLLDIDHGTYPYVTSSNATIGGVCTGLGIGPQAIDGVLGAAKAYTTRVGEGPLPTELTGEIGNRLRESGQEFGAVTGRPRRCGWYDAVAVRYAVRVNGLSGLALTKLDVLDGLTELQVCTAYRCRGAVLTEMPGDLAQLTACEPVYETLPGWSAPAAGARRYRDLPAEAQRYIARLEEITGVPAAIISTGSAREDTIIREDSVAGKWFRSA
jgi:adenylosuccinate synthase